MDLNGEQPPFWSQPTTTITSMPRRRSSAPLLTLPILIVILPIIALLLLFFVVPPFLSLTSQFFRLNSVKKGWDSLNILLVLFAIICGIFARRNDDGSTPADNANNLNNVSNVSDTNLSTPQQWFDDDRPISTTVTGTRGLRRSSSSYPDLRQDSLWETGEDRFRFFDDFHIRHSCRSPDNNVHQLRRTRSDFEEYSEAKVIPVDTFVLRSSPAPPPKSPTPIPPPPPPPPPVVRRRPVRTYQNVGRKDGCVESDVEIKKAESPPVQPAPPPPQRAPLPPPPPPPVQMSYRSEQKYVKIERRKSNATKEIKMVLASLYNQRKRIKRKHRAKNIEEFSNPLQPDTPQYSTMPPPSPPPPPPPLPPHPSSVFQNLFKKGSKSKKVHSISPPAPPPPPPPPPRSSKRKSQARPPTPPPPAPAPPTPPLQSSRRRNSATSRKPPLPVRATDSYNENLNSGKQSPLIPVPPPPPPFKMPEFRFVVRGDFVSIHSARNSRCSSPDPEEVDNDILSTKESTAEKVNVMGGGDEVGSVFCPSPDVNVKADTFIARLRDGWRLEKINSLREKQNIRAR